MQIVIDISEKRYKDILRIAGVQLELKHFQTAEQIIANGTLLEQEPRKGHWILRNSFLVPYECSECNYESERYDNYCPNCGAKMVEPQESEET